MEKLLKRLEMPLTVIQRFIWIMLVVVGIIVSYVSATTRLTGTEKSIIVLDKRIEKIECLKDSISVIRSDLGMIRRDINDLKIGNESLLPMVKKILDNTSKR